MIEKERACTGVVFLQAEVCSCGCRSPLLVVGGNLFLSPMICGGSMESSNNGIL